MSRDRGDVNTGSEIMLVLAVLGAAAAVHLVARPRPARFMLLRIPGPQRHRARARRVLTLNAAVAVTAVVAILAAPDPTGRTQLVAGLVGLLVCTAAGSAGPGYIGAGLAVVIGGPGVVAALAVQLPPLLRIADELAALGPGQRALTHGGSRRLVMVARGARREASVADRP